MSVCSPCVNKCKLGEHGVCLGCLRTIEEIIAWIRMTELEKRQVLAALAERRLKADQVLGNNE